MSQLEDIQLASECVGLEVTREVRARVRRNLERDCADRKKPAMELDGVPELSDVVQSQGKVLGEKKAVGIQGRRGVSLESRCDCHREVQAVLQWAGGGPR